MKEKKDQKKGKFHLLRFRGQSLPDFFDPATDIRKLLPEVAENAAMALRDAAGDTQLGAGFQYILECLNVFGTRVLEDKTSVDRQVADFFEALAGCDPKAYGLWVVVLFRYLFSVQALFCRRDAAADHDVLCSVLEQGRLASLGEVLPPGVMNEVRDAVSRHVPLLPCNKAGGDADVFWVETGEVAIEKVKATAHRLLSHSPATWDELAEACDREAGLEGRTDMEKAALMLAYPTYRHPETVLEVDHGPQGQDSAP